MTRAKKIFLTLAISVAGTAAFNFCLGQSPDIIKRAMRDELNRSMKELSYQDYQKPFFISYTLKDSKAFTAMAMLGALARSSDLPSKQTSVRVLVGGYDFNDESLDDNLYSSPSGNEVPVPLVDDYFGIRRTFWGSTDEVYKSAAKQFEKNRSILKEQNKKLEEIPHRYLAKVPSVQINQPPLVTDVNQQALENLVKKLSAVFKTYPSIEISRAMLSFRRETTYFVNSEGTETQTFTSVATLEVIAQSNTEKGEPLFNQLSFNAPTPDQLPAVEVLIKNVRAMADDLMAQRTTKALEEEYTGPALLLGLPVAEFISGGLFTREGLMASNNIGNPDGYRFDSNFSLDEKIGRKVVSEGLTVAALPKLKKFGDVHLLGAFEVDDEGVSPPEEIVLVENGILKNLLNDRTITRADQIPNGHSAGPGVISVKFNNSFTESELKAKLIEQAKAEGLDFAIIIRDASMIRLGGLHNVYKVSVKDGKEELLRNAFQENSGLKILKKISGATSEVQAYNLLQGGQNPSWVSWIVPAGLLLDGVELKPSNLPFFKDEVYVQNPLKR